MQTERARQYDSEQLAMDAFLAASAACMPNASGDLHAADHWRQLCDRSLTLNAAYMGELMSPLILLTRRTA